MLRAETEPDERAKAALDLVHTDLAGPIEPEAKDGFLYVLSFTDDYNSVVFVYFLKVKSDTAIQYLYMNCINFMNFVNFMNL